MTLMTIYGAKSAKPSSAAKSLYANENLENHSTSADQTRPSFPNSAEHERYSSKTQRNMNDIHPNPAEQKQQICKDSMWA